ncbi:DUF1698 domain-containing protein [Paraburkholderia sediminicola]|uniref:DUF1698 domain-containing protein n=1 Tax=Paraburkholderia sediminicola TaxID=458836 RepID=UPI0038BCB278
MHRDTLYQEVGNLESQLRAAKSEANYTSERLAVSEAALHDAETALHDAEAMLRAAHDQIAAAKEKAKTSVLDMYVSGSPSREAEFKIFNGAWSSDIPGYGMGDALLFDDARLRWIEEQCGGFKNKNILELGPLEGGHTYTMSRSGAASITSIESNTTSFLKCLIVKNTLKFNANFMLGDFCAYLDSCSETFDFLLASGVLYHMMEPVKLLQDMTKVSRTIAIWTHYYDAEIIIGREDLKKKFDSEPRVEHVGTREITSYKQSYLEALQWNGFCGGPVPTSYWLTRESLIGILNDLDFTVTVGQEQRDHQNGPAILLFAAKS